MTKFENEVSLDDLPISTPSWKRATLFFVFFVTTVVGLFTIAGYNNSLDDYGLILGFTSNATDAAWKRVRKLSVRRGTARLPSPDFVRNKPSSLPLAVDKSRKINRIAILRPFGMKMSAAMPNKFNNWETFMPCNITKRDSSGSNKPIDIDVFLSFSQSFDKFQTAIDSANSIIEKFRTSRDSNGWGKCFQNFRLIEANIKPEEDLYLPKESGVNRMWVNGPNTQFVSSINTITNGEYGNYDVVFVMEGDMSPVKNFWLDTLVEEAEETEFAILGSKYDGDSWDEFRSSLPLSLQHHINGNALYNITHPLFRKLLSQLQLEKETPYHAIPYDYRISQILVEGMLGVLPEIPTHIVEEWKEKTGKKLPIYSEKFRIWWETYGRGGDSNRNSIRESKVISNYAGTNLLPRHLRDENASLIHGAKHYLPWDSKKYNITLVISEWHDELATNILSEIDSSVHPFSKIVLMVPDDMATQSKRRLSNIATKIDVLVHKRRKDFFDVCNAPVDTEWFMLTNSYHVVAKHVDLLFTDDERKMPVIPFTHADHDHCLVFPACREAYEKSIHFDPENKMIVQDLDMLFNTKERDNFCDEWLNRYGENKMQKSDLNINEVVGAMGPSATTYISYLSSQGRLSDTYVFSDRTFYGKRDHFKRIFTIEEERSAAFGETALSNDLLQEGSKRKGRVKKTHVKAYVNDYRSLQFVPTVPTPSSPVTSPTTSKSPSRTPSSSVTSTTTSKSPSEAPTEQSTMKSNYFFYNYVACRPWCAWIPTPWQSEDSSIFAKCKWKYSCSKCDQCLS